VLECANRPGPDRRRLSCCTRTWRSSAFQPDGRLFVGERNNGELPTMTIGRVCDRLTGDFDR
jgi:hypothetical protein